MSSLASCFGVSRLAGTFGLGDGVADWVGDAAGTELTEWAGLTGRAEAAAVQAPGMIMAATARAPIASRAAAGTFAGDVRVPRW